MLLFTLADSDVLPTEIYIYISIYMVIRNYITSFIGGFKRRVKVGTRPTNEMYSADKYWNGPRRSSWLNSGHSCETVKNELLYRYRQRPSLAVFSTSLAACRATNEEMHMVAAVRNLWVCYACQWSANYSPAVFQVAHNAAALVPLLLKKADKAVRGTQVTLLMICY